MNRCVIVLGLPRSGTSTVAGTLHRLGVDMGEGHWQPADMLNPHGYYEDLGFQKINKTIAGMRYATEWRDKIGDRRKNQYRGVIRRRNNKPLWGFKAPRACYTLHHILPLLAEQDIDTRMVIVRRDFEAVVASLQRHSRIAYSGLHEMSMDKAREVVGKWKEAFETQVVNFVGPTHTINYEDLLQSPFLEAVDLSGFIFDGLRQPTDEVLSTAIQWINPELNHFGNADNSNT